MAEITMEKIADGIGGRRISLAAKFSREMTAYRPSISRHFQILPCGHYTQPEAID